MTTRSVHLVGAIPADDAKDAFGWVTWILGDTIGPTMPDGQTGPGRHRVNSLVEGLRGHPDLEARETSQPNRPPAFRVKQGRRLRWVDLGLFDGFEASWPVYQEMVEASGRRFQVDIPGHRDVAAAAFGFNLPVALRNLAPFRDATIREMAAIWATGGGRVVFQHELPLETTLLVELAGLLRPVVARRLAREVLRVVEAAPGGSRHGLHLCLGGSGDGFDGRPADAGALVTLANAIMAEWPPGRVLEYVHVPLTHREDPPSMDPDYYAPLGGLWIPDAVRFIGGFIHEGSTIADLVKIRDEVEHTLDRKIDVAAPCGFDPRDRKSARRNLDIAKAVALSD